jgi:hypothetical protein
MARIDALYHNPLRSSVVPERSTVRVPKSP